MTTSVFHEGIPELHLSTLRSSSLILQRHFEGTFGAETIERFLISSYDDFASRITNDTYLPLFAERFARERLDALARVEGKSADDRPIVLFLCTHNAGRSQMALGYFRELAGESAIAWSGGSEPGSSVNPAAIASMNEVGIDISGEFPKPWTDEIVKAADVVVTMGCGDACPIFPGKRYVDWAIADPAGMSVEEIRPIRDEIRERVSALISELTSPVMR
ncbi:MAG: arsenate reductase ArsC [Candidatus Nanopelagicales bacterium]|nr:arsenate reductase ArsC [Candidatus Nanopelagicales bacterium]